MASSFWYAVSESDSLCTLVLKPVPLKSVTSLYPGHSFGKLPTQTLESFADPPHVEPRLSNGPRCVVKPGHGGSIVFRFEIILLSKSLMGRDTNRPAFRFNLLDLVSIMTHK